MIFASDKFTGGRSGEYIAVMQPSILGEMMSLNEKQSIEKATAEIFLRLYNLRIGCHFEIAKLGDSPDVECIDRETGNRLNLEISLIEDVPGDVTNSLGRGVQPKSPTTGTTVRAFFKDSVPRLIGSLEKKLLSSYGSDTALVLRQVSPLWGPYDWGIAVEDFRERVFQGRETNFGGGVWIVCTDSSTWPASDTLFCVYMPEGTDN